MPVILVAELGTNDLLLQEWQGMPVLSTDPIPCGILSHSTEPKKSKKIWKNGKKSCDPDYVRMMMPNTAKQS